MKCEICGADPSKLNTCIYRINEFGVPGIWRCKEHLEDHPIELDVQELVEAIMSKEKD